MDDVLQKILSGIEQLQAGQVKLEQKMNNIRTELLERIEDVRTELLGKINDVRSELLTKIDDVRTELLWKVNSVRSELLEKIDDVRSELLEEIAILEGKVDNNEKYSKMRDEALLREIRLIKLDFDFLKEKYAQHEIDIFHLKALSQ